MADEEKTASTDVEVTVQEPLAPELALPEYHGRPSSGMKTSIGGAGNRISRAHEIGDRVVLVLEAKVKTAGHEETDDGIVYVEKLKTLDLFEIQGAAGKRLLSAVRQAYRTADDAVKGRSALADDGVDLSSAGVTDASGTVLTPAELAELRGDPVRAMVDDRATPVVVVYSDNARELWPDDFDAGAPRPKAGDRYEVESESNGPADYVYVEELLHAETGETLDRWTKEQENARLLELERRAEADEAEEAKAVDGTAAYFRLEYPSGAVEEVNEKPAAIEDGVRLVAVFADGTENLLRGPSRPDDLETGRTEPSSADLEPLDPGAPALPGEPGFGDGLEPLEKEVEFREDEDGFAEPISLEPTPEDFFIVDRQIEEIPELLAEVDDLVEAKRILEAEKRGRGRGLKTRKGAVDLILRRIAELEKGASDGAS